VQITLIIYTQIRKKLAKGDDIGLRTVINLFCLRVRWEERRCHLLNSSVTLTDFTVYIAYEAWNHEHGEIDLLFDRKVIIEMMNT
jgi:hypothetical protein